MTRRHVTLDRPPLALGADAERARILAADRDGVPWRRWGPTGAEGDALPGISDATTGLRFTLALAPGPANEGLGTPRDGVTAVHYLDATPTASYLQATARISSGSQDDDQGVLVEVRYAKRGPEDIVIRIACTNHHPEPAAVHLVTTLSFLGAGTDTRDPDRPSIRAPWEAQGPGLPDGTALLCARHPGLGSWWLTSADGAALPDPNGEVTSAALRVHLELGPGVTRTARLRLSRSTEPRPPVGLDAEATLGTRAREAAAFHASLVSADASDEDRAISREAHARLLWTPPSRGPSALDETFAVLGLAVADPTAAKVRLLSLVGERARHPEAPTEPPLGAWAALRIHELAEAATGSSDHDFLERMFHVLLQDYSGWVDRLDPDGRNALQGGLIGLSGTAGSVAGTAWMGCYSIWMLSLAIELARGDAAYRDVAVTFLDTSLAMIGALDNLGGSAIGMWDEVGGFHHDAARGPDGEVRRLPERSTVGLIPLLAVAVIPREALTRLPEVSIGLNWSIRHRADLAGSIVRASRKHGSPGGVLLSLVPAERRARALAQLDHGLGDVTPAMACLLIDALDRLQAFEADRPSVAAPNGFDHIRQLSEVADDLATRLLHTPPVPGWATLLAGPIRRDR